MPSSKPNYQKLSEELDLVLDELQADNIDVDRAVELYERGIKLTEAIEARLQDASNKITELKAARK